MLRLGSEGSFYLSLHSSSSSPLYLCLELVKSSAGLSPRSRQACGMRVRPLKTVLTCHHAGSISEGLPLPTPAQWDFNFISPCNTTLTAKELEMHYQPAPKLGLLPLKNKIIIRVVIPLNRSFCKYLNPINKVFSWGRGRALGALTCFVLLLPSWRG